MDTSLTSWYKTTTYHSDGRITSREHRGLNFLKVTNMYIASALLFTIVVAAIPFLILLPLLYYVIQPIQALKGINPDFENSLLKNNGFSKLSDFHSIVKTKTIFLLGVFFFSAIVANYFAFSDTKHIFDDLFNNQIMYSKYLFAFYFIVPFFITRERIIVKIQTGQKNFNLFEKLYINKSQTDDNLIKQELMNKRFRNIFLSFLATYALILSIISIDKYFFENKFYSIVGFYNDIAFPSTISLNYFKDIIYSDFITIETFTNLKFHFLVLAIYLLGIICFYLIKFSILFKRKFKIRKEIKILTPILLLSIFIYYFLMNAGYDNRPPLDFYDAIHTKKIEIVEKYIHEGININYKEKEYDQRTPLIYAVQSFYQDKKIIELLVNNGANVNDFDSSGESVLIKAVKRGNIDVIKYLLDNKADINFKDKRKQSALRHSLQPNEIEIAKLLINSGADLNIEDITGRGIVHFAVEFNNLELLKLAISKNVNINAKDFRNETPLTYSDNKTGASKEIKKVLLKNGAVY